VLTIESASRRLEAVLVCRDVTGWYPAASNPASRCAAIRETRGYICSTCATENVDTMARMMEKVFSMSSLLKPRGFSRWPNPSPVMKSISRIRLRQLLRIDLTAAEDSGFPQCDGLEKYEYTVAAFAFLSSNDITGRLGFFGSSCSFDVQRVSNILQNVLVTSIYIPSACA